MNITQRIERSVANKLQDVFLRTDFDPFGSDAQVSRAIRDLTSKGKLVRIGLGVYAKAKRSVLSGQPIPVKPVEVLVPAALKRMGVEVSPSRAAMAYNSGQTTQVPPGMVLCTGKRRIQRKLGFNGKLVQYERA